LIQPLLPGATIGVLGSGQLGRMLALCARRMGYRVHVFSPESDSPAGQVADREVVAPYDDAEAAARFARDVGVVTFEFENVPAATAEAAGRHAPLRPGYDVLHTTQDRLREKAFLERAGVPVTRWAALRSAVELPAALTAVGLPAVLKSAAFGYDGKGQARVETAEAAAAALARLGGGEAILERFVGFEREVSVVVARGADGALRHHGVLENEHARHILDVTRSPARVEERTAREAVAIACGLAEALQMVGVLCVEMFVTKGGGLLVNELAPRPHNSGHLTIEAAPASQFEQQLRAVCGLPLGEGLPAPAAMANLLGDLWGGSEPRWASALALPGVHLHLYGKARPRPGRKMGHLTALAGSADAAVERVLAARSALGGP
jgi:5-(carboxyamino)imidazole ribonucleotide synthase